MSLPQPWVGDMVRDEDTGRTGIVSDIEPSGHYLLRSGPTEWYATDPSRLSILDSGALPAQDS